MVFAKSAVSEGEIKVPLAALKRSIYEMCFKRWRRSNPINIKIWWAFNGCRFDNKERYLDRFGKLFEKVVSASLTSTSSDTNFLDDGDLGSEELTLETARDIFWAGPWGTQFPEPTFCGKFE